jgi:DNA-binding transcriptional MerR regulator
LLNGPVFGSVSSWFELEKVLKMFEKTIYTSSEVTRKLSISLRQLYYWELKGIIKPECVTMGSREFKRYSQSDVETLQKVKQYLEQGYTLNGAVQRAYLNN